MPCQVSNEKGTLKGNKSNSTFQPAQATFPDAYEYAS